MRGTEVWRALGRCGWGFLCDSLLRVKGDPTGE